MRPIELSASEHIDSIAVTWNDSYTSMREFYRSHSTDKGKALDQLEPLVVQATRIGSRISSWFDALENSNLDETTLIARVRIVSSEIDAIADQASNLSFPPQDVRDYYARWNVRGRRHGESTCSAVAALDDLDHLQMARVVAMRHVEPRDVHAGGGELFDLFWR